MSAKVHFTVNTLVIQLQLLKDMAMRWRQKQVWTLEVGVYMKVLKERQPFETAFKSEGLHLGKKMGFYFQIMTVFDVNSYWHYGVHFKKQNKNPTQIAL